MKNEGNPKAQHECSTEHPLFYEHEMEIYLNPKIGVDLPLSRQQELVVTPGQDEKYYRAGVLYSRTGKIDYMAATPKIVAVHQPAETR